MAKEITVQIEDKPGELVKLTHVLGAAKVNIEALTATTCECEGVGLVRFVPNRPPRAVEALEKAGYDHSVREVLIVNVLHEPGALGDVAMVMSDAGINIDAVYARADGRVIFGVDDLDGAMQVAQGMAVL